MITIRVSTTKMDVAIMTEYFYRKLENVNLTDKRLRRLKMRNLTEEEAEIYDQRLNTEAIEINKRIDDAFSELNTHYNRMSGLTRDYRELKQELMRLQSEQESNLLWLRILAGISTVMWILMFILLFI